MVILELESELMDLKYQLEQERKTRAKVEQVRFVCSKPSMSTV